MNLTSIQTNGLVRASIVGESLILWSPKAASRREVCTNELVCCLEQRKFQRTYNPYIVCWKTYQKYKDVLELPPIWTRSKEQCDNPFSVMEVGDDYCFGATKAITHILMVQSMSKSYKDLPICLYEFSEIYEQGPPVTNYFGLTLSIFDTEPALDILADNSSYLSEIAQKHGFTCCESVCGAMLPDDHYVSADDTRLPVAVTFMDCKFEIKDIPYTPICATAGPDE